MYSGSKLKKCLGTWELNHLQNVHICCGTRNARYITDFFKCPCMDNAVYVNMEFQDCIRVTSNISTKGLFSDEEICYFQSC